MVVKSRAFGLFPHAVPPVRLHVPADLVHSKLARTRRGPGAHPSHPVSCPCQALAPGGPGREASLPVTGRAPARAHPDPHTHTSAHKPAHTGLVV